MMTASITILRLAVFIGGCLLFVYGPVRAEEGKFRTDGGDESLPWFQLEDGKFPPPGSAHAIDGELIALDHINRTGLIRPDRNDSQRRPEWDLARPFEMLPYGTFSYHGAPAELRDIPIGTHLHGLFYAEPQTAASKAPPKPAVFKRCLLLEDDFSYRTRRSELLQIESLVVDMTTTAVTGIAVVPVDAASKKATESKPVGYQVNAATRIWKGNGFGTLADLAAGQHVLVNLTVCTLKGPGRCTDVWLDAESRSAATARQLEVHRHYMREHGLAGWVDHVDNEKGIVTATLFGGIDPQLRETFVLGESITAAVAEANLRTYDQINDRKSGPLVELRNAPSAVGSSDFRIRFKPSELLEGFRPQRVIRVWSARWKVDDLPREEKLY